MKKYDKGTAIYLKVETKNVDNAFIDPTSIKISIQDTAGSVKVNEQDMTKVGTETGKYYYIWQSALIDSVGVYTVTIKAVVSTYTSIYKVLALELK